MRVAVIGAHPDDQELGMGGTISRLARLGHAVTLVDLSDGEPTPKGSARRRAAESANAARILRVTRQQVGLRNREIMDDLPSRAALAGILRALRPDVIFTHHSEDAHPDHVAASRLTTAARFAAKLVKCDLPGSPWFAPRLFQYYSVHLKSIPSPSFVVDTTGHSARKLKAILAYRSQFVQHPPNRGIPQWIRAQDEYFGSRIAVATAEPFFSPEALALDPAALVPRPSRAR